MRQNNMPYAASTLQNVMHIADKTKFFVLFLCIGP